MLADPRAVKPPTHNAHPAPAVAAHRPVHAETIANAVAGATPVLCTMQSVMLGAPVALTMVSAEVSSGAEIFSTL